MSKNLESQPWTTDKIWICMGYPGSVWVVQEKIGKFPIFPEIYYVSLFYAQENKQKRIRLRLWLFLFLTVWFNFFFQKKIELANPFERFILDGIKLG